MKNKVPFCLGFFALLLSLNILGQDQGKQSIELAQLTVEQKLDRAVRNVTGNYLAGIAYAKSMGKTPEDFGRFYADLFSFAWADIKGKGPESFVQNWYRFLQTDRNSQFVILIASETEIKAKMTVYGISTLRALPDIGVTIDDYVKFCGTWSGILADNAGLDYNQELVGEWIVFTVSVKK